MANKKSKSKKKVEKPEQIGTYVYEQPKDTPLFVPDDVKIERVKSGLRQARIVKDKIALDFWLRHEMQLGTNQIKKLWRKMDEVYR